MKQLRELLFIMFAAGLTLLTSCKKFEDYQTNPNQPTQADPSLELTNIEQTAFATISTDAALASRYLIYTEGSSLSQYYGWTRSEFTPYSNISQVVKMQQEAIRTSQLNYYYLGKFLTDYYIVQLTETFGDVPFSKAEQAMSGDQSPAALMPAYDSQESIYLQVLNDLETVNDSLNAGSAINGDIIYSGDVTKWKKAINAFSLRVLMSLSLKTGDAQLQVQQHFNNIVSNPGKYPLFASNDDNAELKYYNLSGNYYPYYNDNSLKTDFYMDSSFVHLLKGLRDPRLFTFGKPTTASGLPVGDFNAYSGVPGSAPLSDNVNAVSNGLASAINNRYAYDPINEPSIAIGYAEQEFTLAEAVIRGWIGGSAASYYMNGVQAALDFSNYQGNSYTDGQIQAYLAQPSVQLQSGTGLQQILTQKYISMFMNTGWEPFYNQRRTGIPVFETSGGGILNNGQVPRRWMYPTSEYNNNSTNVDAAVTSQYGGNDNINGVMWMLQPQ
ncbi:MAG: SusD/RagB family nutrient-binding outer membrane lipoprotein [Puia sp.]|nr:SusD/RagB family nutrient-binding outer membrane lipoprotein [Puia sp.]